jgi:hypothetical protein
MHSYGQCHALNREDLHRQTVPSFSEMPNDQKDGTVIECFCSIRDVDRLRGLRFDQQQ